MASSMLVAMNTITSSSMATGMTTYMHTISIGNMNSSTCTHTAITMANSSTPFGENFNLRAKLCETLL